MDWLKNVFSGGIDASRVHPAGLLVMLLGIALAALGGTIARKLYPQSPEFPRAILKIAGLIICAGGAMLAILG